MIKKAVLSIDEGKLKSKEYIFQFLILASDLRKAKLDEKGNFVLIFNKV